MSDTHGRLDPDVLKYFEECDAIWHASDIGTIDVLEQRRAAKPVRAVYGNVDGPALRTELAVKRRMVRSLCQP